MMSDRFTHASTIIVAVAMMAVLCACGPRGRHMTRHEAATAFVGRDRLNVLVIGNSFSLNDLGLLPFIMREVAPDLRFTMGMIYCGGSTLSMYDECGVGRNYHQSYFESVEGAPWTQITQRMTYSLHARRWDIVVLQQRSDIAGDTATYEPHMSNVIDWVDRHVRSPHAIAWLLTHSYDRGDTTSEAMLRGMTHAAQWTLTTGRAALVLPCGTALQLARHTALDSLGLSGHMTHDGQHLQDGAPGLVCSCAAAATLLRLTGRDPRLIERDTLSLTDARLDAMHCSRLYAPAIVPTHSTRAIAHRCALTAIQEWP